MTINTNGRSLELYFIDGKPDGMLTAQVFNWTGHVLMAPRTQIGQALSRKESQYTGIYILLGEKDGNPLAYIGEAEDISDRIRSHDTKKDWWATAILITSTANNLNKAHVKYLEACLIEKARAVDRIPLQNGNTPTRPGLSEMSQSNMEAFLDYLLMVLPAIRVDMFISNMRPAKASINYNEQGDDPIFELTTPKHRIKAVAQLDNGEFVVQAGSIARNKWAGRNSNHTSYSILHAELVRIGVLSRRGENCVFTENYAFKSPSAAAAVVNGRPSNGTIAWKVKGQSKTYKEWEAENIASQLVN